MIKSINWQKLVRFWDKHILIILSGFLLAFIPLYPKIPLFSPIEQYIVRVRLEDIFILFSGLIFAVQFLRKKIIIRSSIAWLILLYILAALSSVLTAFFVIDSVPLQPLHVGKTLLHFFRYLEYFSLFFIVASAIKSKREIKILSLILVITLVLISIYGYGQKYFYWPVYSTMNREFSKGVRLYLTEHARVQSTFGGHYDLAAYLVLVLPIILALGFFSTKKLSKAALYVAFIFGLWILIMSASRTSFVALIFGLFLVIILAAYYRSSILGKIWFLISRSFVVYSLVGLLMGFFGSDMYERFLQVLEGYPALNQEYHSLNKQRKDALENREAFLNSLPIAFLWQGGQKPDNGVGIDDLGNALVPTDERPVPVKPSDVYVEVPNLVEVATISATGEEEIIYQEQQRIFSECALNKGLSLCIRLETLWPRAIAGFMKNPFFGSGFATLNKESVYHFTEAESTDNNFLRTLGETGLAGFMTFYGSIVLALYLSLKNVKSKDLLLAGLSIGYIGGTIGLLINAIYIDVFAASKVALTFWALTGLTTGYFLLANDDKWLIKEISVKSITPLFKKKKK